MTGNAGVRREQSGSAWEEAIGSARAVAAGDRVIVAGMMPDPSGGAVPGEDEPYDQTLSAFRSALAALEPFGLDVENVIRTRMYLSHTRDCDEVGRAHRELFGKVRPAATMVVVAGFADSRVLVEVEIEAYRAATPVASEPVASEPVASEPVASEPATLEPATLEPVVPDRESAEPGAAEQ